jgi:hypothetical protein
MAKYGYTKRGYTEAGYTAEDFDSYWTDINMNVWRPRVQIYDHQDTSILLHEYDSFKSTNDLVVETISTGEQLGTAGTFNFRVRDNERTIDRTKVGNACKVVISMAKHSYGPWRNIASGYIEQMKVQRDKLNGLRYTFGGYGSGIIAQETLTNFKKTATRLSLGSADPDPNDHTMQIKNLMKSLLTDTDHLISSTVSVQEKGNFDLSLISPDLDTFVPLVTISDHPIATAMNFLSERSGSIWGFNAYDQFWAWYPGSNHSGVILKTFKKSEKLVDHSYSPSYFFGPWDYTIPIDQDSFGNVLIAYAGTPSRAGSSSTAVGSTTGTGGGGNPTATPLGTTEVAQQINVTIPNITKISVMLQKIGPLKSKFVNGIIYGDVADQHRPNLQNIIATFQLDISRLVIGVPTPVFSTQISRTSTLPVGSKCWISLQYVGPRNDAQTVMWLHSGNGNIGTDNLGLYYGTREVAATTSTPITGEGPVPFTINNNRVYTFATFYDTKTKVIVRDPLSIRRFGEVERFIDVNWTTDFKTINDLLFLMLNTMSKPQMAYNIEKVSIPDMPFQSGKLVTVIDDVSGLGTGTFTNALISSVSHDFNAYDLEYGIGSFFCDLGISGLYDYLTYEHDDIIENLSCSPPLLSP